MGKALIRNCYRQNWGWMTAALQDKAADYATPEVKRVAKDVVPSNEEDGVAKGIDKWIFSR